MKVKCVIIERALSTEPGCYMRFSDYYPRCQTVRTAGTNRGYPDGHSHFTAEKIES